MCAWAGEKRRPPEIPRRPEIVHGLRNLVQNAVDFARARVEIRRDMEPGRGEVVGCHAGLVAQLLTLLDGIVIIAIGVLSLVVLEIEKHLLRDTFQKE